VEWHREFAAEVPARRPIASALFVATLVVPSAESAELRGEFEEPWRKAERRFAQRATPALQRCVGVLLRKPCCAVRVVCELSCRYPLPRRAR